MTRDTLVGSRREDNKISPRSLWICCKESLGGGREKVVVVSLKEEPLTSEQPHFLLGNGNVKEVEVG